MINFIDDLITRYPQLETCRNSIIATIEMMIDTARNGGTIFIAGNGGSAADAEHICSELLKKFLKDRKVEANIIEDLAKFGDTGIELANKLERGIKAISLLSHTGFSSAFANDVDSSMGFAQQLYALGKSGDAFIAISTSGKAENLKKALIVAKVMGIKSSLLTGNKHGQCEKFADISVAVEEAETYKIQELHLPIYHTLCMAVEDALF